MSLHDFLKIFQSSQVLILFVFWECVDHGELWKEIKINTDPLALPHTECQVISFGHSGYRLIMEKIIDHKKVSAFKISISIAPRAQHEWINQIKTNCISLKAGQSNQQFVFYDSIVCFYND